MLEDKIETCRIRWKRQDSTGKAFRNNCNLKIASCCNLKVSWVGCFFFGRHEKTWGRTISLCFHSNMFGPQLQDVKVWFLPEAVSCCFEKESLKRWSFEWLGNFRSIALRRKNFYRWRCPWYHFANSEVALSIFQHPRASDIWNIRLHLMFCDHVGMATVQNTLAFTGLPTCYRVNCCLHVACKLRTMAGCTHSVWTPESLQNPMKLIQSLT